MKQTSNRQWLKKMIPVVMGLDVLLMAATASAADRYWVSGTGNWSNGTKWNTAWDGTGSSGTPQTGDSAHMSATAPATIYYDVASSSLQYLYLSDKINFLQQYSTSVLNVQNFQMDGLAATMPVYNLAGGTLTTSSEDIGSYHDAKIIQSGGTHTATNRSILGYYGYGMYSQSGGTATLSELYLGYDDAGRGRYELSGTGLLDMGSIVIGNQGYYGTGQGTFIQSGGTITGANIAVSNGGYGTFTQSGGNTVLSDTLLVSTKATGVGGSYSLNGTGSLQADFEFIGESGHGSFTQSGTSANTVQTTLILGYNGTGDGTYNLDAGNLATGYTVVGHYGTGAFNQQDGTQTVGRNLTLGNHAGATGTYNLANGSLQALNEYVGSEGSGIFNQSGGANTVQNELVIAGGPGSTGTYNLSGGTLSSRRIENNGTLAYSGGSLAVTDALTNSGTMTLDGPGTRYLEDYRLVNDGIITNTAHVISDATIMGTGSYVQTAGGIVNNGSMDQTLVDIQGGSLSGSGTITGDVKIASGASVMPGSSPGTMTINGDFDSSGTMQFEIAGLLAGSYDVLDINGAASFADGALDFDFIDGFNAEAGNSWNFLFAADSISGWDTLSVNVDGLAAGLNWQIIDITGGKQLLITEKNGGQPVPEPATMLLMGTGLTGLVAARRKKKAA